MPTTVPSEPEVRRFARSEDGRLVGGVAGGLANHLGLLPFPVRMTFAVLAALSGFGVVLYLALWRFTPSESELAEVEIGPAGLAAAERAGMRPSRRRPLRTGDLGQLAALVLVAGGLALLLFSGPFGLNGMVAVPILVAAGGVMLVWRSADADQRRRATELSPRAPWLAALLDGRGRMAALQMGVGVLVVAFGLLLFLAGQGELEATLDGLAGLAVLLGGVALVVAPWSWRFWKTLEAERRARIVSQERADVAAHLHDSVLQTLALIQKQADNPREVIRLARAQERDLRSWLYDDPAGEEVTFASAMRRAGADIEESHGMPIEVVTVGDAPMEDSLDAAVRSAREAMVNAAKHSGAKEIDVFAEVDETGCEVFIRDRGVGFDLDAVPEDRLGVRRSIIERMERHGGRSRIRSAPGEGTEVWLSTRRTS